MLLRLIHPKSATRTSLSYVTADFSLHSHNLIVDFEVKNQPDPHVNPSLAKDSSQWGLWDWDVIEVFLQPRSGDPTYYEFQVSPLGQHFELEIFEPRKRFNKEFKSGFTVSTRELSGLNSWAAQMRIPLKNLGWDGRLESLKGNAFAILGNDPRTYWSLSLPAQDQPDFHLPHHFVSLFRA